MVKVRPVPIGSLFLIVSLSISAYLLRSPFEVTRLRNSFIADVGEPEDFHWPPEGPPRGYANETRAAPSEFRRIADAERFDHADDSELSRAIAIARHLSGGDITSGEPIQSSTLLAYEAITQENVGYCADYTQVFNALALASNMAVREWGMSFDGFSGDGHAFSEIYDSHLRKWVFIDPFYSFYIVDPVTEVPLSVLEFRERLAEGDESLHTGLVQIDSEAFAFPTERKSIEYYRAGADQFYLWFGNDVFSYDQNPIIQKAAVFGRSVEQAVAILIGAHPKIRILPTVEGQGVRQLNNTIRLFWAAVVFGLLACCLYVYAFVAHRTSRARQARFEE